MERPYLRTPHWCSHLGPTSFRPCLTLYPVSYSGASPCGSLTSRWPPLLSPRLVGPPQRAFRASGGHLSHGWADSRHSGLLEVLEVPQGSFTQQRLVWVLPYLPVSHLDVQTGEKSVYLHWSLQPFSFFPIIFLNCSIVDMRCYISFKCPAEWTNSYITLCLP